MPPSYKYSTNENRLFSEGDFRSPEERSGFLGIVGAAASLALSISYIRRGLRGAGWHPFAKSFWKPLAETQHRNIRESLVKSGLAAKLTESGLERRIAREAKLGFGLRSYREGAGSLFHRTIYGASSVADYLGAPKKVTSFMHRIPRVVMGGDLGEPGIARASKRYRERVLGKAFVQGGKVHRPGLARSMRVTREMSRRKAAGVYSGASDATSRRLRGMRPSKQMKYGSKYFTADEVAYRAKRRYSTGRKSIYPIKSGPLSTVGKIMTRVVAPGYAAITAFNYLDYRTRKSEALDNTILDKGITGGAATMWVKSRMFMQKVLEETGALNAHKYLQTLMPGYLRAAGLAVGAGLSIYRGKGLLKLGSSGGAKLAVQALSGAMVGGMAGYAMEQGLSKSPAELAKIYSGEQKIPIRKGRWWEFGRTPFEGGKIDYYRPHWYPMMMSGHKNKGTLYPSEDWKWEHHWLVGPLTTGKMPDPYAWEKEYYKERPYPITKGVFEDVPLIGPTLEATVGKFIKPRKYMHADEWATGEGIAQQPDESERVRHVPTRAAKDLGLGEIPRGGMGEVASPTDIRNTLGEQQYRITEFAGLPGFLTQEALKTITGKESLYETPRLQDPGRATGFEREYWDRDLGGLAGTTEIFRRFFPHRRRQVQEYNPIANEMGKRHDWLPGPEYFLDFKHGDPYAKVKMGEARLPGTGYEALNELHSNVPGVYDAMDRFMILADVAPYSDEYKHYSAIVGMWSRAGVLDAKWTGKYEETLEQRQERMKRYQFTPRRFSKIKDQVNNALTSENQAIKDPSEFSAAERAIGGAWENTTHFLSNAPIPGASLLASKIIPTRTAIEHYERFRVFGTESASWSKPVKDFLRVYAQEIGGKLDPDNVPTETKKRWGIDEYFDRLEYIKYRQLESIARAKGDVDLANAFKKKTKSTIFGLGFSAGWGDLYRAMPDKERDYFQEFKDATGEERDRIREIISPDMRRIYEAQWEMLDKKREVPTDAVRFKPFQDEDLDNYFSQRYLPGPNWIGWHPDVELDKVKLKVIKNEGMDIHEFNLWESQEGEMEREPIPMIGNYSEPNVRYNNPNIRKRMIELLLNRGFTDPRVEINTYPSNEPESNVVLDVKSDQSRRYAKSMGKRENMMAYSWR